MRSPLVQHSPLPTQPGAQFSHQRALLSRGRGAEGGLGSWMLRLHQLGLRAEAVRGVGGSHRTEGLGPHSYHRGKHGGILVAVAAPAMPETSLLPLAITV